MKSRNASLRRQIDEHIALPVAPIEREIAAALVNCGEYRGRLTSDQLSVIMRKVLYTLIAEQRVAGMEVPIVHNVTQMAVDIVDGEAQVFCEVHIHRPIVAFIQFRYTLINDQRGGSKKLRLKDGLLDLKEITRPLDLGARAALAIMGVKHIALAELSDPNAVIQRTLPAQLGQLGFNGVLTRVELELTDSAMQVYVAGKNGR